jgi:hypothetical protein
MGNLQNAEYDNATIHRHTLQSKFTITANATAEDPNLSWAAKGLLWYIISRPLTWELHYWQLETVYKGNRRGGGRDAVRNCLKELREAGYMKHTKIRSEKGQWSHRYDVYSESQDWIKKDPVTTYEPQTGKPALVHPAPVKASIKVSKESSSTELDDDDLTPPPAPIENPPEKKPEKLHLSCDKYIINLTDGSQKIVSDGDIFTSAVQQKRDWTEPEIRLALAAIARHCPLVRDHMAYIDSIIKNARKDARLKQKKTEKYKAKPCKQHKESQESTSPSEPSKTESSNISEPDTGTRVSLGALYDQMMRGESWNI